MRAKYLGNLNFSQFTWRNDLPMGSKIWDNIVRNRTLLKEEARWLMGNGNQINFSKDPWIIDKPFFKNKVWVSPVSLTKPGGGMVADFICPR